MKVALCTYPLVSAHADRGIGTYTRNLVNLLEKNDDLVFSTFDEPKNPPNVDVVHYPYFDIFKRSLPVESKAKRVITMHDLIPLVFPSNFPSGVRGKLNLFFQKRALKNTDHIICDSKTSAADIQRILDIKEEKVSTIYLAPAPFFKKISNKAELDFVKAKFNLPADFVIFVGDVNWNKNLENLIRATAITKIPLVLVGKSHLDITLDEVKKANRLISSLSLKDNVIKVGKVTDSELVALYNLAKVTALPSHYEGFGLPVLESMACGTPVVCSDNSSLSEIGKPSAILCNPNSAEDIAAKIQTVTSGKAPVIEKQLISQASSYSWDKVLKNHIKVYKQVFSS